MYVYWINTCRSTYGGSVLKNLPVMQETQVWSLGWEDALEKEMTTHPSILSWRIPQTEEPGGLWSTGPQTQTGLSGWATCPFSHRRSLAFCWASSAAGVSYTSLWAHSRTKPSKSQVLTAAAAEYVSIYCSASRFTCNMINNVLNVFFCTIH